MSASTLGRGSCGTSGSRILIAVLVLGTSAPVSVAAWRAAPSPQDSNDSTGPPDEAGAQEVPPPDPVQEEATEVPPPVPPQAQEQPPPTEGEPVAVEEAGEVDVAEVVEEPPPRLGLLADIPVDGTLSLRYRGRWTSDDSDHDLYGFLSLDVGDESRHPVTAHVTARASQDLDGERNPVYSEITDTFSSRFNARLYDAYLDVHTLDDFDVVRLGRQTIYDTPELAWFDGARVETREYTRFGLQIGGYGGAATHLYESSHSGDWLAGAFVGFRPWKEGRLRFDWMYMEDDTSFEDFDNSLYGAALWQNLGPYVQLHGRFTSIDWDGRDYLLRGTFQYPDWDLSFQTSYYELLKTQRALALEVDNYFAAAGDYHPYYQVQYLVTKGFGEHFDVGAGADVRRGIDADDRGTFNREFQRYYVTPTIRDVGFEGLALSVTGEYWSSPEEDIETYGADLSQEFGDDLEASVGTAYLLYKYDFLTGRERDHVRVWYGKADYQLFESLDLRASYEWEKDEDERYHTVKVGLTWTF